MATTIIVFGFSLLLCAGFALPVERDLNPKNSLDVDTADNELIKRTINFDAETVLKADDKVLEQSLDSDAVVGPSLTGDSGVKSLQRNKRAAITGNGCSRGWQWIANQCVTLRKYKELRESEEDE